VPLGIPTAYAAAYGGRSFPLASLPGYYIPGWFMAALVFLSFELLNTQILFFQTAESCVNQLHV